MAGENRHCIADGMCTGQVQVKNVPQYTRAGHEGTWKLRVFWIDAPDRDKTTWGRSTERQRDAQAGDGSVQSWDEDGRRRCPLSSELTSSTERHCERRFMEAVYG